MSARASSPVLALYRTLSTLAEPAAPYLLRGRVKRGKEDPDRLGERLGRPSRPRPDGPLAWLHGASVGESLSLLPLVSRLRTARPELALLVTSGTVTSAELLAKRLPEGVIHQYAPVDTPAAARRFLQAWRPDLAIFVESEFWPNLLLGAKAQGARLAALSARLSAGSARNWARAPAAARQLLGGFDLLLPQDEEAAARLTALGGRDDGRLNLKLVGDPLPADAEALEALRVQVGDRPLLLAASTHWDEEATALEALQGMVSDRPAQGILLVVAPRHPMRGGEIAARAREMGFETWLRSEGPRAPGAPPAEVWVADALGELGLWFRLAASAFVGGSLAPDVGGHNPLEPARLVCPMIAGPHVANWATVYRLFDKAEAIVTVHDAEGLDRAWRADLDYPRAARARAERAWAAAQAGDAELDQAVQRLLSLIA